MFVENVKSMRGKTMSEISVIVPVYKVEKYLHRCVESILRQTFIDFELILVDDGSPDKCGSICDKYAEKDSRVHVLHQQNAGLSAARNSGIDWAFLHSKSKWLTFIDSDDWIHPELLQYLYDAVNELNMPISICGYYETQGEDLEIDISQIETRIWKTEDFYSQKPTNATVAWGKLYRKECFNDIRYPRGKLHEDEYVTYRILFKYAQIAVVDAPLYAYFQNQKGIMQSQWSPQKLDALEAIDMQLKFFRRRNLQAIYKDRVRAYVASAIWQYKLCRLISSNRKITIWIKSKIVCKFFTHYNQNVWDRKTKLYIAEILFPHLMNAYWILQAFKNRLKTEGVSVTAKRIIMHFTTKIK